MALQKLVITLLSHGRFCSQRWIHSAACVRFHPRLRTRAGALVPQGPWARDAGARAPADERSAVTPARGVSLLFTHLRCQREREGSAQAERRAVLGDGHAPFEGPLNGFGFRFGFGFGFVSF